MKPLVLIYWTRLALGIIVAIITAFVATMQNPEALNTFLNGVTIALLVHLISYYVFKAKFQNKVEKPSKIMTMGIGIYFISWAVFYILSYSVLTALTV